MIRELLANGDGSSLEVATAGVLSRVLRFAAA